MLIRQAAGLINVSNDRPYVRQMLVSHLEDDLASRMALETQFEGIARAGEGKNGRDDRLQRARID